MKQVLCLFLVFSFLSSVFSVTAQKPLIVVDQLEHNFGTFKESDGVQTTTFSFTNNGTTPLIINNVRASCGCTTPKWTREPVAPGGKGEIQVSYNPRNRPGAFNKTVVVSSNAQNSTFILRITGRVEEEEKTLAQLYPREIGILRAKTNYITFSRMKETEVKTQQLELVNDTQEPVEVDFRALPGHLSASIEPKTIPAKGIGKLSITFDANKTEVYGHSTHRIYLSLNGSNDYRASIGISVTIEEDFSHLTAEQLANAPVATFSEKSFDFGEIKQGEKKEHIFQLTNEGKKDLMIRNIRASCGCTAAKPSKTVIPPGESVPVKVSFDSRGKRGRQTNTITIITNDPKIPTNTLRIIGNVTTEN